MPRRISLEGGSALALLALAVVLTLLAHAEHARATAPRPAPSAIRVLGEAVDVEADPVTLARRIAARWAEAPIALIVEGRRTELTRGGVGGRLDEEALGALLSRAFDPDSLLRRHHERAGASLPIDLEVGVTLDPTLATSLLLDEKERIDVRADDARIRARTGEIVPERAGRALDVVSSLRAIETALTEGAAQAHAVIAEEHPRRTAASLEGVRTGALLGFFETRYSTLEDSTDRTFNLRVAAARLDGIVVMPGESFHFNAVVGPRTEANGFRPAPEIAGGELVDGVGGGTCQIAGTLHAAAFFAGLRVETRRPHSRPSAYLWMGLDATVVYPDVDLVLQNDQAFPIVLGFTMEGGVARAEIRGAVADRMVSFTRRIDETVAFIERDEPDPSLPAGVRVLRQRGVPGFHITWFRTLRDVETNQALCERGEDAYPPTDQIWRVGSGAPPPADFVSPAGDAHLPYAADSYLVATEGVGVDGLAITRR